MMFHAFESQAAAAEVLARRVAADLAAVIGRRGHAVLAVSGGRSPVPFLQALSAEVLDWSRVCVTLVDERVVAPGHADSNAALVRDHLLQGGAADATFRPLVSTAANVDAELAQAAAQWQTPDVVVLGMGDDGHTASLFPDAANLAAGLDPANPAALLAVVPPVAPHTRISMTLAEILRSGKLYLAIAGDNKRRVLEQASRTLSAAQPVSHLLQQTENPLHVYWAA
ncbi:6-phosphogluconolactonase [Vogesella sp. EB]|uniref:6-phosphogluconolactonase n=1 Tax=Vogesella sp. EB TaxID=1526735 RepID=UPI00064D4AE2|nr:6-phosphogluconolactonase [Vogesella sp. EB]KMJ54350.1 6-phosphogluconolactonase [Vogesella sp. EB]